MLIVRTLGLKPYEDVFAAMKSMTDERSEASADEIWLVEHPPVFTQGQAGKAVHVLSDIGIPVVQSDRGGQVTYHGPGQLVAYLLFDIRRQGLGVRDLVTGIEQAIIALLGSYNIEAQADPEAPGVYVAGSKIAALGLRVRKGRSYHGLSLNVDLDLTPFDAINPCGYQGLKVTRMADLGVNLTVEQTAEPLVDEIARRFRYDDVSWTAEIPYL